MQCKRTANGFTLLEVVLVLALIGILAAVAVPKYLDLTLEAEDRAVYHQMENIHAVFMEAYAKKLLQGGSCEDAAQEGIKEAEAWSKAHSDIFSTSNFVFSGSQVPGTSSNVLFYATFHMGRDKGKTQLSHIPNLCVGQVFRDNRAQ